MQAHNVNYSYWELKEYFTAFDLIVIGSGIVGLSTAISFRQKNKKAKVLILERGMLPSGASTKNAGFACFGSPGEILDDLDRMDPKAVWETVAMRLTGLRILRKRIGDRNLMYEGNGGFELFDSKTEFEKVSEKIPWLNKMVTEVTGLKNTYSDVSGNAAVFSGIKGMFMNRHEGQLDTSFMMSNLLKMAHKNDIKILNNVAVSNISGGAKVRVETNAGVFTSFKVVVATNGFAARLLNVKDVKPARAQVLVTKPLKNLKLKGAYHYQQGYYYFRNIDGRILFGGGRNLDMETETTTEIELNAKIQRSLDELLKTVIIPGVKYEVEHRWAGIMGVGSEKKPIIRFVGKNILAAVRMGGMGVAIGSWVGENAASKISES